MITFATLMEGKPDIYMPPDVMQCKVLRITYEVSLQKPSPEYNQDFRSNFQGIRNTGYKGTYYQKPARK